MLVVLVLAYLPRRSALGAAAAAERLIRMTMHKAAFGWVSQAVKLRILTVLYPFCPDIFCGGARAAEVETLG